MTFECAPNIMIVKPKHDLLEKDNGKMSHESWESEEAGAESAEGLILCYIRYVLQLKVIIVPMMV